MSILGMGASKSATRVSVVRLRPRAVAALTVVSLVGVVAFTWPLYVSQGSVLADGRDGPWLFALLLPLLLALLVAEVSDRGLDAKAVAMLGVLTAIAAALRPLGPGVAGLEPMFVVFILGGRVLGPGFGFLLGSLGMFASALLTGGMGPWLPLQVMAAGWVGLGAGLLPGRDSITGRAEIGMLAGYAMLSGIGYGMIMNLWAWPTMTSGMIGGDLAFQPGASVVENLGRFVVFSLATSVGWDITRGVLNMVLVVLAGPVVLLALRRAARRANFAPVTAFSDSDELEASR